MERRAIAIQGTVQGVGFRPFVHRLASAHHLGGSVRNQTDGVWIEVEGDCGALDDFFAELLRDPPPLAKIDDWFCERRSPLGQREFHIDQSDLSAHGVVVITPDAGTCDACLAEIRDPTERRHRYPFTNCTHCGPRLTIVTGSPYDRERTTMAAFQMCADCRREYEDPTDRRFHAQPIACPACGPRLALLNETGEGVETADPLIRFAESILTGKIGAMKGLGGYHLVCDARNSSAVAELRRRKHRDEKPLAIMTPDLESAAALCDIGPLSAQLLSSPKRPIVLLRERQDPSGNLAAEIAPGNPSVGVMLPYTPLHYLLLDQVGGIPLVMTSGNRSDEPIAFDNRDAVARLAGIADIFLTHDRPIHIRCDDSVTRVLDGVESPVRRSRGYAPQPLTLPMTCPAAILAVGGQVKATFALGVQHRAILSHHMGDLDNFEAFTAFERDIALYESLFSITPICIAHDLHPDYASTRYAVSRAGRETNVRLTAVQHHHAHMASCMAEHGLCGPVIGVIFDGTGFGMDGTIWGGEFLVGGYDSFERAAHFRPIGLPGGDQAVREPWRVAAAHLLDAGVNLAVFEKRISAGPLRIIEKMLERKFNAPMTSSAGRLFDAVAALIGLRDRVSYEGQAAMELEWLATGVASAGEYPFDIINASQSENLKKAPRIIDLRPMIREIVADVHAGMSPEIIARKFHSTLVEIIATVCKRISNQTGIIDIVFSGGVFMNALLSTEAKSRLAGEGFRVYRHQLVPPNDGGLSLGQVAVAARKLLENGEEGDIHVPGNSRKSRQNLSRA